MLEKLTLGNLTMICSLAFVLIGMPQQIWKIWQTRSVKDVSLGMFILLDIQLFMWVFYGIQKRDLNIIIPNVFATLFTTVILFQYFWFKRKP